MCRVLSGRFDIGMNATLIMQVPWRGSGGQSSEFTGGRMTTTASPGGFVKRIPKLGHDCSREQEMVIACVGIWVGEFVVDLKYPMNWGMMRQRIA